MCPAFSRAADIPSSCLEHRLCCAALSEKHMHRFVAPRHPPPPPFWYLLSPPPSSSASNNHPLLHSRLITPFRCLVFALTTTFYQLTMPLLPPPPLTPRTPPLPPLSPTTTITTTTTTTHHHHHHCRHHSPPPQQQQLTTSITATATTITHHHHHNHQDRLAAAKQMMKISKDAQGRTLVLKSTAVPDIVNYLVDPTTAEQLSTVLANLSTPDGTTVSISAAAELIQAGALSKVRHAAVQTLPSPRVVCRSHSC
jgi:hypothetical protein